MQHQIYFIQKTSFLETTEKSKAKKDNMTKNNFRSIVIACALAAGGLFAPAFPMHAVQQAETAYDYETLDIPVLCGAIWYGCLMNTDKADHTTQAFQTILGTKALGSDGLPQNESIVYSFLTFQSSKVDDRNPMPAVGHYTMGDKEGDMIIENSAMIYKRDGNGNFEWERKVTDGHLDITATEEDGHTYWSYDLVLVDDKGKKHHVTYKSRFVEYDDQSQDNSMYLSKNIDVKAGNVISNFQSVDDSGDTMHVKMYLTSVKDEADQGSRSGCEFYTELFMPYNQNGFSNGTYSVIEEYGPDFSVRPGEILNFAGMYYPVGSYVQYVDPNGGAHWGCYQSGTITISGEGSERTIVADFTTVEGFNVKFTYTGELILKNLPEPGLTADKTLDLQNAEATFEYYGDKYEYGGASTWFVTLKPTGDRKDGFQTELSTKTTHSKEGIPTGNFRMSTSTGLWPGEYAQGRKTETLLTGTWYLSDFDEDGIPHLYIPARGGDLSVVNNNDGTYTIDFVFDDGLNNTWSGKWTGKPTIDVKVEEGQYDAVEAIGMDNLLTIEGRDIILSGETILNVADTQGRVIFNGRTSRFTLPAAGLYILTVEGKAFKAIVK